jgi:hypothetical protein
MSLTISDAAVDRQAGLLAYRPGRAMACPACGERHWLVGRIVAECVRCETALPIEQGHREWLSMVSEPIQLAPFPIV